jgi:hypothetical protein
MQIESLLLGVLQMGEHRMASQRELQLGGELLTVWTILMVLQTFQVIPKMALQLLGVLQMVGHRMASRRELQLRGQLPTVWTILMVLQTIQVIPYMAGKRMINQLEYLLELRTEKALPKGLLMVGTLMAPPSVCLLELRVCEL